VPGTLAGWIEIGFNNILLRLRESPVGGTLPQLAIAAIVEKPVSHVASDSGARGCLGSWLLIDVLILQA
jgi:hypothetical protein